MGLAAGLVTDGVTGPEPFTAVLTSEFVEPAGGFKPRFAGFVVGVVA